MLAIDNFIQKKDGFLFHTLHCLRFETSLNHCSLCAHICQENAFEFNSLRISLNEEKCTSCGVCIGSCPSGALQLEEFDTEEFTKNYSSAQPLSCQTKEISCLALFNESHLVSMFLKVNSLTCDTTKCSECEKNRENKTYQFITQAIQNANAFLQQIAVEETIKETQEYKPLLRREIFKQINRKLTPKKEKKRDFRNQTLLESLQDRLLPKKIQENTLIFSKEVNSNCTLCRECQEFCPTNALTLYEDKEQKSLSFQIDRCINCGNCQLICKKDAIKPTKSIDLEAYLQTETITLFVGKSHICSECKCSFISKEGEEVCDRCKKVESLPTDLFALARDLP